MLVKGEDRVSGVLPGVVSFEMADEGGGVGLIGASSILRSCPLISISGGGMSSGSGVRSGVGWPIGSPTNSAVWFGTGDGELDILTNSCVTIHPISVSVLGFMMSIGLTLGSDLETRGGLGISDMIAWGGRLSIR